MQHFYHRYLPPVVFLLLAAWGILSYVVVFTRPPIGTYIAILTFLAVVVTIWPPEGKWAQACWLIAFF